VTPGKVILGNLDGIEAGVRQMIRKTPLEVAKVSVPSGGEVTVPTIEETLRIKAFLTVRRNQARDYLDLAALAERLGINEAARVLSRIDDYYADQNMDDDGVTSQLTRQLSNPQPADKATIDRLSSYRRLQKQWSDWDAVTAILGEVAESMAIQ
jgi:predicted nucleotidyltransferase component of viral defense system